MKLAKSVTLYIGIILAVVGIIMELTSTTFTGSYLSRRMIWITSSMSGKTLMFFGLVFILLRQLLLRREE
jgi:hypothetical protein